MCFFTDLKHVEGIKVSENGFEIFSSNHVENLNIIGPGLKKLFEMAGLDINIISDPTYKQELDKFVERNRKTLTRMSVRKPKGYKKQAYKNIGPAPQSPPPSRPVTQRYGSLYLRNVEAVLPPKGVTKPKIGPKPNIGRPKTNTAASGPNSNVHHGSKPNISNKPSPYAISPILTTPPIPTAPPPPPISTTIANCSLESRRILQESISKFDTSLLKKAEDLPKEAPKEGGLTLTSILMEKLDQIQSAMKEDSFDSDIDSSDDETYWTRYDVNRVHLGIKIN